MLIYQSQLSTNWDTFLLSEVVEFLDNQRKAITERDRVKGPYPYYGANGQQDSVAEFIFDEPLVLLAEDGGHFGDPNKTIAYQITGKCWVNNHAHVLRPKDCIDIRYLYRHLERYDVTQFVTGTTRGKLTKSAASRIPIVVPPLEEQRRIAAILDKADDIRRKRKQAIALTEELLRSTFLDMFGDPVTNPKGWEIHPLSKVCNRVTVGFVGTMSSEYIEEGVPWLRSLNIKRNRIVLNDLKYVSNDFHRKLNKSSLLPGDVVAVRTGNAGVAAVIPKWITQANCSDLIVMTCSKLLVPAYLAEILNFLLGDQNGGTGLTGAIQKHFNISKAKQLKIPLPPLELQTDWNNIVNKFEHLQNIQTNHQEESNNLFNSLLQKAFRGEL
ncbi:restriction endonuclease subunit S [Anabaenopsis tanganyikae CS-531]|uniref:Restriction endonuclease subunit S n=2 Tax=Anabaenopsis TaxID=110103 RepID=A0ABT5AUG9_9CYAN|nr:MULTISPECIES: restriction endonuclease subunit S [Anabaenopsis]MDB9540953.1 restriction endonuclease subunit S [Anabaenopsis arnoldii]MDH6093390.1 restriction endonuclease subunit S [Anabaenopsis arnoldii]MDH6106444.1 restriction endonuclease subunit S [Anabaenopsis tanganyikae CS-531]